MHIHWKKLTAMLIAAIMTVNMAGQAVVGVADDPVLDTTVTDNTFGDQESGNTEDSNPDSNKQPSGDLTDNRQPSDDPNGNEQEPDEPDDNEQQPDNSTGDPNTVLSPSTNLPSADPETIQNIATLSDEVDISWYNADSTNFTISTVGQLKGLAQLVNEGNSFAGKTVTLTANIDLNNEEWTPIGTSSAQFSGIFDGSNHTISNLYIHEIDNGVGLFGYIGNSAVVTNLTIQNISIEGTQYVGSLAGYVHSAKIENINITGKINIAGNDRYIGGLAGHGYAQINNCHVMADSGSYIDASNGGYVGGLIGFRGETSPTISNCSVNNIVISAYMCVGGIAGMAQYASSYENCSVSNVTINALSKPAGLIIGDNLAKADNPVYVLDCNTENSVIQIGSETLTVKAPDKRNAYSNDLAYTVVGNNVTFDENNQVTGGVFDLLTDDMFDTDMFEKIYSTSDTFELKSINTVTIEAMVNGKKFANFADAAKYSLMYSGTITLLQNDLTAKRSNQQRH